MEHSRLVLKGPDGQPLMKNDVILLRRGAFRWMPVGFSNDLVYGSWWFVAGSILMTFTPIYPLYEKFSGNIEETDDLLPASDFYSIWILMIVCGIFFLLGSLAFTRAFNEPPLKPLLADFRHFQTDELLASWCYFVGMMPFMPYMFIFFVNTGDAIYFFGFLGAVLFSYASYLGVASCYPGADDQKHENTVFPFMLRWFGAQLWIIQHLSNDWLAGTWILLWGNVLLTFGCFVIFLMSLSVQDPAGIFNWSVATIESLLFTVGSMYFVSGSYPHASQFYYAAGRGQLMPSEDEQAIFQDDLEQTVAEQDEHSKETSSTGAQAGGPPRSITVLYDKPSPPPIRYPCVRSLNMVIEQNKEDLLR